MPFSQRVGEKQDYCCIKLNLKRLKCKHEDQSELLGAQQWIQNFCNTIILKFSEKKPRYIKIIWSSDSFFINILISLPSDKSISQQIPAPKPFFLFVSEAHFTLYWEIQTHLLINLTSFDNLCVSLDVCHPSANLSSVHCLEFQDFDIRGNKPAKQQHVPLISVHVSAKDKRIPDYRE